MKKWTLLYRFATAASLLLISLFLSAPYLAYGQANGEDTGGLFGFPVTANLGIGYTDYGGDPLQNASRGIELELSAYTSLSPRTTVSGGVSYASPELNVGSADGSLTLFGVFANIRYYLAKKGTLKPFLGVHVGAIHQNKKIQTPTLLQRTRIWGEELEGRAGLEIAIASNIRLDFKGGLGLVYFGQSNDVVIQNGQFQSVNRDPSLGTTYTIKVGISYRTH